MVKPEKAEPITGTTLRTTGPGRRTLGSELHRYVSTRRDKVGTDPMADGGIFTWTPPWKSGGISRVRTIFSLGGENEQADAGRDGNRLVRPNS